MVLSNPVLIFVKTTRRRSRGSRSIFVVDPSMAGAHKESRLGEPPDRTAEVCAVDGKDLESIVGYATDPTRNVGHETVPRRGERISVGSEAGLTGRKLLDAAERYPSLLGLFLEDGRKYITENRDAYKCGGHGVETQSQCKEETSPRDRRKRGG
jgi:hypothetical protein